MVSITTLLNKNSREWLCGSPFFLAPPIAAFLSFFFVTVCFDFPKTILSLSLATAFTWMEFSDFWIEQSIFGVVC